jgi:hypothetical protein
VVVLVEAVVSVTVRLVGFCAAYARLVHAVVPVPTLNRRVSVSNAISPRASVGFALVKFAAVSRRIRICVVGGMGFL